MKIEYPKEIHCLKCKRVVGTVTLVPVPDKPGFYRSKPDPDPMPSKCDMCDEILTRKLEGLQ